MKKLNAGFTLLETMIVIAIIAIISALATPNMISYIKNNKFSSEVHSLYSYLQNTRSLAIKRNRTITLSFNKVANDKDTYIAFIDSDNDGVHDVGEEVVLSMKKIDEETSFDTIKTVETTPVQITYIRYNALGFSRYNSSSVEADITLTGYKNKKATIKIDTSGNIGIQ